MKSLGLHLLLALLAVAIFAIMHVTAGRIEVRNGEGWDGSDYAVMLREGWIKGSVYSRLRPLVIWMNQPALGITGDAVRAFDAMNFVYAGAFALLLSLLMEQYGASPMHRAVAIVCLGLSNGFRLPAYYPVLIDLGACAVITLALWAMVSGRRWVAAMACVAAVLAREYAPVVLFFGAHRDWRKRVPFTTILATYLPAALVYLVLRVAVALISVTPGNTLAVFIANRYLWTDPMFVGLFFYFLLTCVGGLSLVAAAQVGRCWSWIRDEPEWISFALPIVMVSALVGIDIWRYLVTLAPMALVFYARCSREWSRRDAVVWSAAAMSLTLWTQQPFARMDLARYFADWFPYYAWTDNTPDGIVANPLWPDWTWRFVVVACAFGTLILYAKNRQTPGVVMRT